MKISNKYDWKWEIVGWVECSRIRHAREKETTKEQSVASGLTLVTSH